jgi:branched-chain amino acid transport system permease protein
MLALHDIDTYYGETQALFGVAFFLLVRDLLGAYTETWLLWYGLAFMAMVLFKPEGIVGMWRDGVRNWKGRPSRRPPSREEVGERAA